jgi:hypothetical protein
LEDGEVAVGLVDVLVSQDVDDVLFAALGQRL